MHLVCERCKPPSLNELVTTKTFLQTRGKQWCTYNEYRLNYRRLRNAFLNGWWKFLRTNRTLKLCLWSFTDGAIFNFIQAWKALRSPQMTLGWIWSNCDKSVLYVCACICIKTCLCLYLLESAFLYSLESASLYLQESASLYLQESASSQPARQSISQLVSWPRACRNLLLAQSLPESMYQICTLSTYQPIYIAPVRGMPRNSMPGKFSPLMQNSKFILIWFSCTLHCLDIWQ